MGKDKTFGPAVLPKKMCTDKKNKKITNKSF